MRSVSLFTKLFLSSSDFVIVKNDWKTRLTNLHQILFSNRKTSSETIQMVQKAFGKECMSKTRIKEWYNRFKGGRTFVDSDSCSGRPSTTKTLDNIERVWLAIEGDRRLTVRELENDLGIPKTTVWEILNKILEMTRVCAVIGFFTAITR